jgi:hypothetical protein
MSAEYAIQLFLKLKAVTTLGDFLDPILSRLRQRTQGLCEFTPDVSVKVDGLQRFAIADERIAPGQDITNLLFQFTLRPHSMHSYPPMLDTRAEIGQSCVSALAQLRRIHPVVIDRSNVAQPKGTGLQLESKVILQETYIHVQGFESRWHVDPP